MQLADHEQPGDGRDGFVAMPSLVLTRVRYVLLVGGQSS